MKHAATRTSSRTTTFNRYQVIDELYQGVDSSVRRVRDRENGQTVILKICHEQGLAQGALARYKNELKIVQAISSDHVIRCFGFEEGDGSATLILEDIGGRSLQDVIAGRPLPLKQALDYARLIAEGLNDIHAAHVIHKDINPRNVVVNETTGAFKIIDFGASTMLSREQQAIVNPGVLAGTLTYISPEQTGRMNRAIDYRCDFYSLGATLYEMLTGRPPFVANDPLDLVHLHIAKYPIPPREVNADIPKVVSDIVLRLLAKNAEDRYQSAFGIKSDLAECIKRLDETGAIATFELGRQDRPHQFRIPQKLYGREKKIELLLQSFDKVANGGREIMLIGGYSGIGKTSLVREIYRPITERRGYFASGKFNQFHRNAPLKTFFDALRELIKQLLTEDEERLVYWRQQIGAALDSNGQVIVDVFPELEVIIGPQPPVPELGPAETQNRMNLVFGNFIQAFCSESHPLVLFLDDLQWIDSSSLAFLVRLLKDESIRHLMIVGAYRNNEVDQAHPLMIGLQSYKESGGVIDTIVLEPLKVDHVRQLLAEALRCDAAEARAFAELITQKTEGNPFFIEEFLKSLYGEGLLTFDSRRGRWTWDLNRIQTRRVTDNVVDLMTVKLQRLEPQTKRTLSLAACLGDRFDIYTLAAISRQTPAQVIDALRQALETGLADPVGGASTWLADSSAIDDEQARKIACQFSHDRVQYAAYGLISPSEKPGVHKSVAELMLANTSAADMDERVFDIVSHFNAGISEITDLGQIKTLAELTLRVANTAQYSGANDVAYGFVKNVIDVLPEEFWRDEYGLTFSLYVAGAEAAQACAKYKEMEWLNEVALGRAAYDLDKAKIAEIRVGAEIKQVRFASAVSIALDALRQLGVSLPTKPSWWRVRVALWRVRWALFGKSDEDLMEMSEPLRPKTLMQRRLSILLGDAAYWVDSNLFLINCFQAVRAAVRRRQQLSAARLAAYGMMVNGTFGDTDAAYRYGALTLRMVNQPGYEQERARVYNLVHSAIYHWKRPARESLPGMLETYRLGIEVGQPYFAANGLLAYCYMSFHCGKELTALNEEFIQYNEVIQQKLQFRNLYDINGLYHQALLNLMGKGESAFSLSGAIGKEDELLRRWEATQQNTVLHTYYFLKLYLTYHFGRLEDTIQFADAAKRLSSSIMGTLTVPVSFFYDSLVRLAVYASVNRRQQRLILKEVAHNQTRMREWARHAPANHQHKFLLVEAELDRIRGRTLAAMDKYDQAIGLARKNEYTQEEALANELAAKFHLARGSKTVAGAYIRQAVMCYQRWGANAKVEELRRLYPQLAPAKDPISYNATVNATITGGLSASGFDLRALVKALKGIAEEKSHSQLLEKTISTAMEFAGADSGVLILRKAADSFFVEAEISIDQKTPRVLQSIPLEDAANISPSIINYVKRTRQSVVVNDGQHAEEAVPGLGADPYIKSSKTKSILCMPLIVEGAAEAERLIGLLYLENKQASNSFDEQRIETLGILCLAATGRLELSRKAMTDGLTELYNHDTFQGILAKEFSASQRTQRKLSVIMVDIDHFKKFNDQYGHQMGDTVLKQVAGLVKSSCRLSDVVARYGGEEMAVILPDTDSASALIVAERIRSNVEACEVPHNGSIVKVTVSLGVSTITASMKSPAALVKTADEALYLSKNDGRNRVSVK